MAGDLPTILAAPAFKRPHPSFGVSNRPLNPAFLTGSSGTSSRGMSFTSTGGTIAGNSSKESTLPFAFSGSVSAPYQREFTPKSL